MPSQSSSLPTDLQAFIQAEMARRCLASEAECLAAILREARARQAEGDNRAFEDLEWPVPPADDSPDYNPVLHGPRSVAELENLLEEGLNSGPGIEATPEYWAEKKAAFARRHGINRQ